MRERELDRGGGRERERKDPQERKLSRKSEIKLA